MRDPKIEILSDKVLYNGNWVELLKVNFRNKQTGEKGYWEMLRRKPGALVAAVAPVTEKNELVLTKIFRIPVNGWVIDLCAGLTGKNELPFITARRELLEELGYACGELQLAHIGSYNPGLLNDNLRLFIAWNAKKVQNPKLEGAEDIEEIRVPINKAAKFLNNESRDATVDLKVYSALYFIQRFLKERRQ